MAPQSRKRKISLEGCEGDVEHRDSAGVEQEPLLAIQDVQQTEASAEADEAAFWQNVDEDCSGLDELFEPDPANAAEEVAPAPFEASSRAAQFANLPALKRKRSK